MVEKSKLDENLQGKLVDATLYRGMIGSLVYLTSSRPDLIYAVCLCARYQANPIKKHLNVVKRIFRYLKGTINVGLGYSKDTDRLEFKKCNMRLRTNIKPKEATFQVVLDALALTPFYLAFLITTDVPAIYIFTKIIIDYFMSKDQSISRKNKMFWHTARDDTMYTSMRCISRHEDTQVYGTILPKELTNQEMLESNAYKTYNAFASGEKAPKPNEDEDDENDSNDISDEGDDDND
nr:uncharacterized mitochondrial protein AtMg00810-like [Tanacetum cinerariifolium]